MDDRVKACCAGFYELPVIALLLGDELHPGGAALTRELAATSMVGRDTRVLDVACGRGQSARMLATRYGCRVVGIDYSGRNIGLAQSLTRDAGLTERVQFLCSDAEELPFDSGSFDVVICECSLCTFPGINSALREFRRVLRARGRVGISDVVLKDTIPESLQDLFGRVLCISGALSVDGYRDALRTAGFLTIRTRDVSRVLSDTLGRIQRRVATLGSLLNDDLFELPDGLRVSRSQLADARDLVLSGAVGYALITARKPGAG